MSPAVKFCILYCVSPCSISPVFYKLWLFMVRLLLNLSLNSLKYCSQGHFTGNRVMERQGGHILQQLLLYYIQAYELLLKDPPQLAK